MQECFRKHPEVYAEELRDDAPAVDKPEGAAENSGDKIPAKDQTETAQAAPAGDKPAASAPKPASNDSTPKDSNTHPAKSVEDLDRRLDARGLVTDASEAEEGRHVDASDANKEAKKEAKAKKEKK
jgi:intermembrane space import and assembly protein 40